MRRSAAPSYQSSAKRLRFLSPILKTNNETEKENDLLNYMDPDIAEEFSLLASSVIKPPNHKSIETPKENEENLRSSSEILKLILGEEENNKTDSQQQVATSYQPRKHYFKSSTSCVSINATQISEKTDTSVIECDTVETNLSHSDSNNSVSCYSVLWCKRSAKKHKIWEGDGILTVKNRSAVLKNSEGKEIDRGLGYKFKDISSLEEGSKFYVGSKECEIQNLLSSEVCVSEEKIDTSETLPPPSKFKKANKKSSSCM